MKQNKLKLTKLQNDVFRLLCIRAGEELTQLEVAQEVRASSAAVSKSLPLLKAEGLIRVGKRHGRLSVSIDRESRRATELKMVENIRMLFESGIIPFLEEKFPGSAIILFGYVFSSNT